MKTLAIRAFAIASVVAAIACSAPPPAMKGTADDETAIRGVAGRYAEAFNKGDVAALAQLITEDYEALSPDGKMVKGRAQFEAMEKEGAAQRASMPAPMKLNVSTSLFKWTSATSATAGGTWTMEGLPPGAGADKGAWQGTFVKDSDNQWRMATGLVSEYHPQPTPMATPTPTPPAKGK